MVTTPLNMAPNLSECNVSHAGIAHQPGTVKVGSGPRPMLRDRRAHEQRGSPYDAKCNVAEIGCTVDPLNLVGLRRQSDRQHYVISRHRTSSGTF